jgi:hypothetical protein
MINKININTNQPLFETETSTQQNAKSSSAEINTDASLQLDNTSLLDSAMQNTQTEPNLVQNAKEALLSGKLDSFDNIMKAAENILKFGV